MGESQLNHNLIPVRYYERVIYFSLQNFYLRSNNYYRCNSLSISSLTEEKTNHSPSQAGGVPEDTTCTSLHKTGLCRSLSFENTGHNRTTISLLTWNLNNLKFPSKKSILKDFKNLILSSHWTHSPSNSVYRTFCRYLQHITNKCAIYVIPIYKQLSIKHILYICWLYVVNTFSIMKTNWLMLFTEIIAVYSETCVKHIQTHITWKSNSEF
jgi:hypothetical protein